MRRLSTLEFGRRAASQIDNGQKLHEALSLPMVRDVLDTMDAHDCARFFLVFPFQVFKSLLGQLRLLRNHYVRSRPALWYAPTGDFAKEFADTKLNLLFEALPELRALRYEDKTKDTKLRKILTGGASHLFLSAATEPDRHGKSACDIYRDESHLYEAGWMAQISNRRGSYPEEFTETDMTTGLIAGTDAANLWSSTDRRTWHWRCPACHQHHAPRYLIQHETTGEKLGGLRYERHFQPDGLPDESAIAATLAYECPLCHVRFPDAPGTRAAFNGTAENPLGHYRAMNPTAAPRAFGWTCHGVALRSWLPMVIRFEKAQLARARGDLEPLGKCVREEFADVWDPEKYHRPQTQSRFQHPTPYTMAEEWADELRDTSGRLLRFAKIDVQLDYFVLVIRKWGRFSSSRLHYAALALSPSEIALHCTREKVPPERVFFDGRHDTQRIRSICARMGWRTMMGDKEMRDYLHEDGIRRIYDKPKAIDAFTGTVHQGQNGSLVVETLFSKNAALDRLALLRSTDSVHPLDGSPLWTAASDAPDWYYKQINAHYRKRVESASGAYHHVWHGQKDDHADDCEAMHIITATMAGLTGAESMGAPETENKN
jgi:phage terminase large subunit GpA